MSKSPESVKPAGDSSLEFAKWVQKIQTAAGAIATGAAVAFEAPLLVSGAAAYTVYNGVTWFGIDRVQQGRRKSAAKKAS